MTLIATPGAANANTFCTLAEAFALQAGRPGASSWALLDEDAQETLLRTATQRLSLQVGWYGAMVAPDTQALPLPMVGQVDQYGRALAEDIIPPLVVQATALYALALASDASWQPTTTPGVKQLDVVGDVRVTFAEPAPAVAQGRIPFEVWGLVRFYGTVPALGRHMDAVRG